MDLQNVLPHLRQFLNVVGGIHHIAVLVCHGETVFNTKLTILLGVEDNAEKLVSYDNVAIPLVEGDVDFAVGAAAAVDETLGAGLKNGILEG